MSVHSIRYKNLVMLLDKEIPSKKKVDFAKKVKKSETYISSIFKPEDHKNHKNLGNALARHIEKCFDKPEGWLDVIHEERITGIDRPIITLDLLKKYSLDIPVDELKKCKTANPAIFVDGLIIVQPWDKALENPFDPYSVETLHVFSPESPTSNGNVVLAHDKVNNEWYIRRYWTAGNEKKLVGTAGHAIPEIKVTDDFEIVMGRYLGLSK